MMYFDKELADERAQLFTDLYSGTIPKRVPISIGLSTEISIQNAGLPLGETLWTRVGLEEAMENVVKNIRSDTFPSDSPRSPIFAELSGSKFWQMGKSGFMQHPENASMSVEEYDELIKNPYDYILEKLLPGMCVKFDTDPVRRSLVTYMSLTALNSTRAGIGMIMGKLSAKYSYFSVPMEQNGFCLNPFDFLADCFRGFTGIMNDIKRHPGKVLEATEAILPMLVEFATPDVITNMGSDFMPCHMPTFMRTSEFEKFFYPGFSRLIHALAEKGQTFNLFCEDNWMRYLDHLQDLPQGTRFQFEYGVTKIIKEKLGKDHIICGLYPSSMLKTHTKEQCIDKAKELIDILAPGGNYYFNFDKSPMTLETTSLENLYAVIAYIADNAKYDNAGERAFKSDRASTIKKVLHEIPKFESKYYVSKEDYMKNNTYPIEELEPIVAAQVSGYEKMMMKTILRML